MAMQGTRRGCMVTTPARQVDTGIRGNTYEAVDGQVLGG